MKKKLLLFLTMAIMLVCIFAISAFAQDVEWGEITYGGDCNEPTIIDPNARIKMSDGKTYPAYYFIWNATAFTIQFDKAKITKDDGSNYTISDIVMLEIPEGVQTFNWNNSGSYHKNLQNAVNLTYVKFPKSLSDPSSNALANCTSLVTADLSEVTLTKLSAGMFYKCTSLVNVILPKTITTLSSEANTDGYGVFEGCKSLTSLDLPNITYIGRSSFKDCKNLDFEISDKITHIGDLAFSGSGKTSLTIPDSVTSIGKEAFKNCAQLVTVNPCNSKNLTSLGADVFFGCTALKTVYFPTYYTSIPARTFEGCTALDVIYISSYLTSIGSRAFYDTPWTLVFRYAGTQSQMEALQSNTQSGFQVNTGLLYDKDTTPGELPSDRRFAFYGYNLCELFYENKHIIVNPTLSFTDFVTAFLEVGACSVCEESGITVEEHKAIITLVGYSAQENGPDMCVSYTINKEAYEAYKRISEKELQLGVTASIVKDESTTFEAVKLENGVAIAASSSTICAEISTGYSSFDLIITGFDKNEEYADLKLVMCAYVVDGEEVDYICYNESGVAGQYATAYTTTLNTEASR